MTPLSNRAFTMFTPTAPIMSVAEIAHHLGVTVPEATAALHNDLRFRRLAYREGHPGFAWTTNDLHFGTVPKKERRRYDPQHDANRLPDWVRPGQAKRATTTAAPPIDPLQALEPKPRVKRTGPIPSRLPGYLPRRTHRVVQWLIDHPGEHTLAAIAEATATVPTSARILLRHPWVAKRLEVHPHYAHSTRCLFRSQVSA